MPDGVPDAVQRLAVARNGEGPFLLPNQIEAARRLAATFERARLRQRVTMSYDPTRIGGKGGAAPADISNFAADARRTLLDLSRSMPADCWTVLLEICGHDRGLQETEADKGWPRRGGKLVLRIALSQLARVYGLDVAGVGKGGGITRTWLPDRPDMFPNGQ
jgi:hypothetical protein